MLRAIAMHRRANLLCCPVHCICLFSILLTASSSLLAAKYQQDLADPLPALTDQELSPEQARIRILLNEGLKNWLQSTSRDQDLGVSIVKQMILNGDLISANETLRRTHLPTDKHGFTSYSIRKRMITLLIHQGQVDKAKAFIGPLPLAAEAFDDYAERLYLFSRGLVERGNFDQALEAASKIRREFRLPDGTKASGSYRRELAFIKLIEQLARAGQIDRAKLIARNRSASAWAQNKDMLRIARVIAMQQSAMESIDFLTSCGTSENLMQMFVVWPDRSWPGKLTGKHWR